MISPIARHLVNGTWLSTSSTQGDERARIASVEFNGVQIMNTQLLQQARVLDIDEQIELVEAIWDGTLGSDPDEKSAGLIRK